MNTYIQKRLAKIQMTLDEMSGGYRRMVNGMKKLGLAGSLKAIWDDLFANRSLGAWIYLAGKAALYSRGEIYVMD